MRTLTFQALVNDNEVEDMTAFINTLVDALEAEDPVDNAWHCGNETSALVIVNDAGNPELYGPFQNAEEAEGGGYDGTVIKLNDPDELG